MPPTTSRRRYRYADDSEDEYVPVYANHASNGNGSAEKKDAVSPNKLPAGKQPPDPDKSSPPSDQTAPKKAPPASASASASAASSSSLHSPTPSRVVPLEAQSGPSIQYVPVYGATPASIRAAVSATALNAVRGGRSAVMAAGTKGGGSSAAALAIEMAEYAVAQALAAKAEKTVVAAAAAAAAAVGTGKSKRGRPKKLASASASASASANGGRKGGKDKEKIAKKKMRGGKRGRPQKWPGGYQAHRKFIRRAKREQEARMGLGGRTPGRGNPGRAAEYAPPGWMPCPSLGNCYPTPTPPTGSYDAASAAAAAATAAGNETITPYQRHRLRLEEDRSLIMMHDPSFLKHYEALLRYRTNLYATGRADRWSSGRLPNFGGHIAISNRPNADRDVNMYGSKLSRWVLEQRRMRERYEERGIIKKEKIVKVATKQVEEEANTDVEDREGGEEEEEDREGGEDSDDDEMDDDDDDDDDDDKEDEDNNEGEERGEEDKDESFDNGDDVEGAIETEKEGKAVDGTRVVQANNGTMADGTECGTKKNGANDGSMGTSAANGAKEYGATYYGMKAGGAPGVGASGSATASAPETSAPVDDSYDRLGQPLLEPLAGEAAGAAKTAGRGGSGSGDNGEEENDQRALQRRIIEAKIRLLDSIKFVWNPAAIPPVSPLDGDGSNRRKKRVPPPQPPPPPSPSSPSSSSSPPNDNTSRPSPECLVVDEWSSYFLQLREYVRTRGDAVVPHDSELGTWVSLQRLRKRRGVLSEGQANSLRMLGFDFGDDDDEEEEEGIGKGIVVMSDFYGMLRRLRTHLQKHGDCLFMPPRNTGRFFDARIDITTSPEARGWKGAKKRGCYGIDEDDDEEEEDRGQGMEEEEDEALLLWVTRLRLEKKFYDAARKKEAGEATEEEVVKGCVSASSSPYSFLTPSKVKILEDMGFYWEFDLRRVWIRNYRRLNAFYKTHGHCRVTKSNADIRLYRYAATLRTFYRRMQSGKSCSLTPARVGLLERIGFVFEYDDLPEVLGWDRRYEMLCEFHAEHGHCVVPQRHPTLGEWVKKMRSAYAYKMRDPEHPLALPDEKQAKLEALGFVWRVRPARSGPGQLGSSVDGMGGRKRGRLDDSLTQREEGLAGHEIVAPEEMGVIDMSAHDAVEGVEGGLGMLVAAPVPIAGGGSSIDWVRRQRARPVRRLGGGARRVEPGGVEEGPSSDEAAAGFAIAGMGAMLMPEEMPPALGSPAVRGVVMRQQEQQDQQQEQLQEQLQEHLQQHHQEQHHHHLHQEQQQQQQQHQHFHLQEQLHQQLQHHTTQISRCDLCHNLVGRLIMVDPCTHRLCGGCYSLSVERDGGHTCGFCGSYVTRTSESMMMDGVEATLV